MQEEIGIGEHVRTEEGIIQKCTDVDNSYVYADDVLSYNFQGDIEIPNSYVEKTRIVKHSKNITDLIEDGDYLNGYLVRKINGELCNFDLNEMKWIPLKNIDIFESLVTHKQFKSIEYKI